MNLAALLRHTPGADDDMSAEGVLELDEEVMREHGLRLAEPLQWSLHVINAGGDDDFVVTGDVHGTALLECRRCLTDAESRVRAELVYPMRYRPGDATVVQLAEDDEASDDLLEFAQPVVDFAPLLIQAFAIDVPLTALCREDCRGLATDGVNLNEHPDHVPAGEQPTTRSPFDALKDIDL